MRRAKAAAAVTTVLWLVVGGGAARRSFAADLAEQRLEVNGVTLKVTAGGSGEPLVVVHGGPGLGADYLIPHFAPLADTRRLVFYDQRGSGGSTGDGDPSAITMDNLVADLEGLRLALRFERMAVIGQSFGALVAIRYAAQHPDRVTSLLLLEPAPGSSEYLGEVQKRILERLSDDDKKELQALVASEPFTSRNPEAFARFMTIRFGAYYKDRAKMTQHHLGVSTIEAVRKFFVSQAALGPYMMSFDIHPLLAKVSCPTLILHGDYDPVPTEACERLHRGIAGSRLVVFPDCGHFAHIEAREAYFKAVREFLASTSAT
ncbi:MAG: alpha/beta fold hydrolase [Acidobacteriota bacterium]